MDIVRKIIIGLTLIAMFLISYNWSPWGMQSLSRKVWDLVADLMSILFLGGALYAFFCIRSK